jgi:transcriptional regulator with AAA-type ATPase domain
MEEKQYFRPGTSNEVKVDVRILASATVDLDAALADGADFYFYLSTFTILFAAVAAAARRHPFLF